jgi:RNA recognition motif-containing protein
MSEVLTSSASGDRPTERSDSFIDDDADFVKLFVGQASSTIRKHSKIILFTVSIVALFFNLTLMQIPKDMNEELLLPFFSEFGPVAELTVIRDKINQTHKGALLCITMYMMRRNLQSIA